MTSFIFPAQANGENTSRPEEAHQLDRRKKPGYVSTTPRAGLSDRPQEANTTGFGRSVACAAAAQLRRGAFFEQHIFPCFLFIVFIFSQIKDTFWVVQGCSQLPKADDSHTAMQK